MKIVVIAWGSLVWDRRDLAVVEKFERNGPLLPVEFSRISGDGRLTLVVDEKHGPHCSTYSATSSLGNLGDAIQNLRVREGVPSPKGIGFVDVASGNFSNVGMGRHPQAVDKIKAWTKSGGYDAAIWTALASNFYERAGEPFSVEGALAYLGSLETSVLNAALNYIRQAPSEIQTPVRAAVSAHFPEQLKIPRRT